MYAVCEMKHYEAREEKKEKSAQRLNPSQMKNEPKILYEVSPQPLIFGRLSGPHEW